MSTLFIDLLEEFLPLDLHPGRLEDVCGVFQESAIGYQNTYKSYFSTIYGGTKRPPR